MYLDKVTYGTWTIVTIFQSGVIQYNGTEQIRHQCRETVVLSCHRFLINSGVEKMNNF